MRMHFEAHETWLAQNSRTPLEAVRRSTLRKRCSSKAMRQGAVNGGPGRAKHDTPSPPMPDSRRLEPGYWSRWSRGVVRMGRCSDSQLGTPAKGIVKAIHLLLSIGMLTKLGIGKSRAGPKTAESRPESHSQSCREECRGSWFRACYRRGKLL